MLCVLYEADMAVMAATTASDAAEILSTSQPDAILLDLTLPDMSGPDLLRRMRLLYEGPIIIVSSDERESMKIRCLDAGADDFIPKPFDVAEFTARIRAVLRRYVRTMRFVSVVTAADLEVDLLHHQVRLAGAPLRLNAQEYALLSSLAQAAGSAVPHSILAAKICRPSDPKSVQYLRSTMCTLRRRITRNKVIDYEYIKTIPKFGYSLAI